MTTLNFCNNGEFDPRAMLTMGVSAKESGDAIGFFGTGFKYAVAIILRLGGSITVKSGNNIYNFKAITESIRGQNFDVVYMNGEPAGFTTRMGINWKPWMAFRELYCNAKDEGGEVVPTVGIEQFPWETVITVNCHEVCKTYDEFDKYFISGQPLFVANNVEVYEDSRPYIYYRGIAAAEVPGPSEFSYNILSSQELTEDRTLKHEMLSHVNIVGAWAQSNNINVISKWLKHHKRWEFKSTPFFPSAKPASEFMSACAKLINTDIGLPEIVREYYLKHADVDTAWPEFELNQVQEMMLNKAKTFLKTINVDADRFEIKIVSGLGEGVMGRALDGVIYLSEIPFQMGTKQVASTLLEEWVHNKYGCKDFDYIMQNWLFDKIISLGEVLKGEPL